MELKYIFILHAGQLRYSLLWNSQGVFVGAAICLQLVCLCSTYRVQSWSQFYLGAGFVLGIHHTILEALFFLSQSISTGKIKNKNALTNCFGIVTCPYLVLFQRRMLYLYTTWLFIKLLSVIYKHITTACHVLIDVDIYVSKSAVFNTFIESTTPGSSFNCYGLTLILAWIRDYINYKVWHAIICQCPNFNGASPYFTRRWLLIHVGIKVKPR